MHSIPVKPSVQVEKLKGRMRSFGANRMGDQGEGNVKKKKQ